jgi:ubiquitin carboxyl-terminal hydrolase 25
MFQIETALLRFDELAGSDSDKTSVVKRYVPVCRSYNLLISSFRLFFGKLRQRISAPTSPRRSKSSLHEKEDLFSHLPVQVSDEGYDLYDGISAYFDDTVEFEGRQARMEVSLIDLPPILQIQLQVRTTSLILTKCSHLRPQRVLFDRDTMQAYKSNAYVKFDETIYMDRFLDRADSDKKTRAKVIQAELNTCRERIQVLTKGKVRAPYHLFRTIDLESD